MDPDYLDALIDKADHDRKRQKEEHLDTYFRGEYGKCDARGCGSPAEIRTKFGARLCRGHYYLADPWGNGR